MDVYDKFCNENWDLSEITEEVRVNHYLPCPGEKCFKSLITNDDGKVIERFHSLKSNQTCRNDEIIFELKMISVRKNKICKLQLILRFKSDSIVNLNILYTPISVEYF